MGKLDHEQVHFHLFVFINLDFPAENAGNCIFETLHANIFCPQTPWFRRSLALEIIFSCVHLKNLALQLLEEIGIILQSDYSANNNVQ